ncbi:hypothetical protein [Candidatus Thioglobus sp.]|uniref:hypothetical protein n=1 Tax=Candidatus Thioglobus sp. TaxID=2026721 RepID=UPI003D0F8B45
MLKFIENGFLSIVHKLGFLFAFMSLALIVFLAMFGYEKITSQATDDINPPVIELAKYQNPISLKIDNRQPNLNLENSYIEAQSTFTKEFDEQVERIIGNLQSLPEGIIKQQDLQFKIKVMIKIKSSSYSQALKLAYVESLVKLTKQLVNVGGNDINIDKFLHWHDQEFARQVDQQTQQNLIQIGLIKSEQMTGLISLITAFITLGFFIMFVMMMAMLRIERNTRK